VILPGAIDDDRIFHLLHDCQRTCSWGSQAGFLGFGDRDSIDGLARSRSTKSSVTGYVRARVAEAAVPVPERRDCRE